MILWLYAPQKENALCNGRLRNMTCFGLKKNKVLTGKDRFLACIAQSIGQPCLHGRTELHEKAPITPVWLDKYQLFCSFLQYNQKFGNQDLIRSLYTRMSEADKQTETGQLITAYLNLPEEVNVGDEMVDGDLYDLDGNVRHLTEFKGKYILLDFWSQGCGPCVQSLPEMEEITEMYKGRMEVISISQDPKDEWKKFIAENN